MAEKYTSNKNQTHNYNNTRYLVVAGTMKTRVESIDNSHSCPQETSQDLTTCIIDFTFNHRNKLLLIGDSDLKEDKPRKPNCTNPKSTSNFKDITNY